MTHYSLGMTYDREPEQLPLFSLKQKFPKRIGYLGSFVISQVANCA
jgi:hypothetical protein